MPFFSWGVFFYVDGHSDVAFCFRYPFGTDWQLAFCDDVHDTALAHPSQCPG